MIAAIRIKGQIKVSRNSRETLDTLKLRKKYACVLMDENNPSVRGMIKKSRNFIAYGEIDDKTLKELIAIRGQKIDKKKDIKVEDAVKGIKSGKKMQDFNLKPFFRLHPPRKGISTKEHYPKGALGNHGKDINKLIMRML